MADAQETQSSIKKGVPLWAQVLIWIGLLGLLGLLASMLLKAKEPVIQKGVEVPDFSLPLYSGYNLNGRTDVKLSEFRGKVVVVNFWASWCDPCKTEAAELESAWREFQGSGQVMFLGIDYVDTEPEARAYMEEFELTYPNGPDMGTRISQLFNRHLGVPETYIIDQDGILQYIQIGPFASMPEIRAVIDPLLVGK